MCCTPSTPQTTKLLLRNKKLQRFDAFQISLQDFCPAHNKYQTAKLCTTAASLPGSSQQGRGLSLWLADQLPTEKRNPLAGTCSQRTAAAMVSREIWFSYCRQQFMHICRCDTFASHDLWEGNSIALKVCQWYHLALIFSTSKCSTSVNEGSLEIRAKTP